MAIQQAGKHAYGVQWSEWYSEQQYGDEHTQRRCLRVCQCREEPEEEQTALDAEVKKMEEQNAKTIEVKSHKREVRKPVMRRDLPVEETHIYPDGVNLEEYTEIGVETTDRIAIRPAVMYIDRIVRHKFWRLSGYYTIRRL